MEKEYLTKDHLIGFDNYKYSCKDTGILSIYVMHPFWNWLVQYCPRSIAPNLLTFTGFLFTVSTYVMFTILDCNFYASDPDHPEYPPIPKWAFTVGGIFLFIGYTLDGIDGKQARRTGTSGPLGELFDHGLDSYTAGLIPGAMYSIFGRGSTYSLPPFRMFFTMWNVMMNFYLSHFEKYNTGVLFLPWGYDFSMWGTILTFLVAGIGGHEIWQFRIGGINTGMVFEMLLYVCSLISNVPVVAYNIYASYKNGTGKMRSFSDAIRPLLPVSAFFLLTLIWILYSPSNIVDREPRALFFLLGTVFSNISCRLIVAQMSNTTCEAFNLLLVPTSFVIMVSILTQWASLELFLMHALCLFTTIAHMHYGTCVVRQMCRHFKVNCFTIKEQSD
ncbi:ethanolaminephosphotransferase 1 [Leptinotarsa decemlineata]|uniref:ethanolaminephosphotransferase 1 n=1 Tax=Leptinotarsa decemlineata TaxID=7539 RepID=UPI000C2554B6|nr:ethanolaminephosphotransferase 1 [Leptinotarsa decemlineata]